MPSLFCAVIFGAPLGAPFRGAGALAPEGAPELRLEQVRKDSVHYKLDSCLPCVKGGGSAKPSRRDCAAKSWTRADFRRIRRQSLSQPTADSSLYTREPRVCVSVHCLFLFFSWHFLSTGDPSVTANAVPAPLVGAPRARHNHCANLTPLPRSAAPFRGSGASAPKGSPDERLEQKRKERAE